MRMKHTVLGLLATLAILASSASQANGNINWSVSVDLGHAGHPGYTLNINPGHRHGQRQRHQRPNRVWHRPVQQVVYGARPHRHGNNWCRVAHVNQNPHARRVRSHRHH